ncbi:MAG: CAP domain-containing protein [Phycisphaerales bacterium]|nr:CAP domain-containing protein [Phycisphaerales bacterium]MCB9864293.1 CAP domain-containing protein [Phycisphaerales bacterium]
MRVLIVSSFLALLGATCPCFESCPSDQGGGLNQCSCGAVDTGDDGIADRNEFCNAAPPASVEAEMSDEEIRLAGEVFSEMNDRRTGVGLAPLIWHPASARIAFLHSRAMDEGGFEAHLNPITNMDQNERAFSAGIVNDVPQDWIIYDKNIPYVGEVIFYGSISELTGRRIVSALYSSVGHRAEILAPEQVEGVLARPAWTHAGVGVRYNGAKIWVTAMFFRNPNCKL